MRLLRFLMLVGRFPPHQTHGDLRSVGVVAGFPISVNLTSTSPITAKHSFKICSQILVGFRSTSVKIDFLREGELLAINASSVNAMTCVKSPDDLSPDTNVPFGSGDFSLIVLPTLVGSWEKWTLNATWADSHMQPNRKAIQADRINIPPPTGHAG